MVFNSCTCYEVTCTRPFSHYQPHICGRIQKFNQIALISKHPKLPNFIRFWDLRAFAGFCGRFADFCGRFAGNFGRGYVHLRPFKDIYTPGQPTGVWESYSSHSFAKSSLLRPTMSSAATGAGTWARPGGRTAVVVGRNVVGTRGWKSTLKYKELMVRVSLFLQLLLKLLNGTTPALWDRK